jgi:tRNA nucleotidyltransferase (CCA-adding enzyme)
MPELETGPLAKDRVLDPPAEGREPVLLTALLTSEPAKVLRRLKASNAELERAAGMERGPEAPTGTEPIAVRRWLAAVGSASDDLAALWSLRRGAEAPWAPVVRELRLRGDPLARSDLAITGTDIQQLGVGGPRIGEILAALLDRVLDDPSLNTRDALLALAREML